MKVHVCTTDSFFVYPDDSFFVYPELNCHSKCVYCGYEVMAESSYIGLRCTLCGNITYFEEWAGYIAKKRREKLNLTRKQIAQKMGLSKHTIKKYEYIKCSQKYSEFTLKLYSEKIRMSR